MIADDDVSVDISLDLASIFEDRAGKKLTPVKEKLRRKKSTRSMRSSTTADTSSITMDTKKSRKSSSSTKKKKKKTALKKEAAPDLGESADDILKRWNSKIDLMDKEVDDLDKRYQEASVGDLGLAAPREMFVESSQEGEHVDGTLLSSFSPRLTSPRSKMTRHLSISCMSSAGSSLSGDSTSGLHQEGSISVPRRPSLHSLFEWNKQPSQSNLMVDSPNIVTTTSRQLDRRSKLRRSMSTTDIKQYNNTPIWPPTKRQVHRNLHAQFYRRDTKLPTPPTVNRGMDSSPVVTTQQLLQVMEPCTMRDVLAFSGLGDGTKKQGSRKLVNYGDILDNASSSNSLVSSNSLRGL